MNNYFENILHLTGGIAIGALIFNLLLLILIISIIVHYFRLCKDVEVTRIYVEKIANMKEIERIENEEAKTEINDYTIDN